MLYYLVSSFFKNFMSLEIEIISMMLNQTSCETNCTFTGGHLPYLFEVKGFRSFNKGFSSKCRDMSHVDQPDLSDATSIDLNHILDQVGNVLDKILTQNNSFDVTSYPDLRIHSPSHVETKFQNQLGIDYRVFASCL